MAINSINREIEFLSPEFRRRVIDLNKYLIQSYETGLTKTLFKVFETYRTPFRQAHLLTQRVTKAGPWQSPHQFGLAADFVPYADEITSDRLGIPVGWNWHSANEYSFLASAAKKFDCAVPIKWDPCHVEHPDFQKLRKTWKQYFE